MIEVAAAVILQNEKILIAKRGAFKDQAGLWEFPGGKIETYETAESCLLREIREELAIEIRISEHFIDNIFHYPNKSILLKSYICHFLSGSIQLTDHDQVEWVDLKDLVNFDFAPADVAIVSELIRRGAVL